MNLPRLVIILFLSTFVKQVCAETLYVAKENDFAVVPESVAQSIRQEKRQVYESELFNNCKTLSGKSVILANNVKGYVVSTNTCGCGSASCPVWVVDVSTETPRVLIADGGVIVKISENSTSSMPEIIIVSSNAGTCLERVWNFNGNQYVSSKWAACSKGL
jgi:hypothetical protein